MNFDFAKFFGLLRVALAGAAPTIAFLVTSGVPPSWAAIVVVVALILVLGGWSIYDNQDARIAVRAGDIKGVSPVKVDVSATSEASPAMKALALDKDVKGVQPL